MKTALDPHTQPKLDSLRHFHPMEIAEICSDIVCFVIYGKDRAGSIRYRLSDMMQ